MGAMFLLRGAAITFFTHGENKEPGTVVHVFVTNRDATTATPDRHADFVAHRLDEERYEHGGDLIGENRTPYLAFGLGLGANQTFDDPSTVPFSLGLGAFDLALDDIVLPAVAIHIQPDGSDRWIFDFELALFFTEADGSTRSLKFESARDGLAARFRLAHRGRHPRPGPPQARGGLQRHAVPGRRAGDRAAADGAADRPLPEVRLDCVPRTEVR
jgi:hypothetical protein